MFKDVLSDLATGMMCVEMLNKQKAWKCCTVACQQLRQDKRLNKKVMIDRQQQKVLTDSGQRL